MEFADARKIHRAAQVRYLGRKSIHVCARTQKMHTHVDIPLHIVASPQSFSTIGTRSKKKQRAEILTARAFALQPIIAFRSGDREVLVFPWYSCVVRFKHCSVRGIALIDPRMRIKRCSIRGILLKLTFGILITRNALLYVHIENTCQNRGNGRIEFFNIHKNYLLPTQVQFNSSVRLVQKTD